MLRDRAGLRRRLRGLQRRLSEDKPVDRGLRALRLAVDTSRARRQAREDDRPSIDYPLELPVVGRRGEIEAAIRRNPVVIVCGETGSGKTTQLPKICLEMGRGIGGLIGHTQPRRIAARSVAQRLAEELGSRVGEQVGFKVRFSDHVGPECYVKLMTDGILLAEIQQDRLLSQYDTLIIDEAHERSLNIDFLLGYLKGLLPRRPDLKLIITSATIDPQRFSRHFGGAPIVEVSGRTYPVEVRYRPLAGVEEDTRDLTLLEGIVQAADELAAEGQGDILVFLPGERDIREAAEALRKHHPRHTEILPLYARLSATEQHRVFESHRGRRIVLATNVAETSLTVPGIKYVIDSGLARISRYSWRSKLQRLPIEPISRASANQRAGRCGRVSEGICIRLYHEQDFERRDEFTEPEILRTNLASVILQMEALGLGDIEAFPFVEAPDTRLIKDGYGLLQELGAVDDARRITDLGRRVARLPVDPRLARMLIAAEEQHCLRETLIIVSALAVQDPRERPLESQQAADQAHSRFLDERSDFVTYLNLWDYYHVQLRRLSKSKLRKMCRDEFLSFFRMREWLETHRQLRTLMLEGGATENQKDATYPRVHRALLSGLLSHIGMKDDAGEFLGARNRRFRIFPGSGLFKKPPKWIMASEIAETARVYARTCARIEPEWLEPLARPLMRREIFQPHWQRRAGRAGAYEKLTLYGLTVVQRRRIDYTRINPEQSRELLIRHALVYGEYEYQAAFLEHNRKLVEGIEELEARARRRDILVDEDTMYGFYDRLVPEHVTSMAAFEKWRTEVERHDRKALFFRREALMQHEAEDITAERFPDTITVGGLRLPLSYRFEPEAEDDGVSVTVPAAALNQLDPAPFEWLVPGLFEERLTALIRALPKTLRKNFVPAPDFARALAQRLTYREGDLYEALGSELRRMTGVEVAPDAWADGDLPRHLRMRFRVIDAKGEDIAIGRDLDSIKSRLGGQITQQFRRAEPSRLERDHLTDWDFGELPETVEIESHGIAMQGFPALVDHQGSVALRVLDNAQSAQRSTEAGVRRLCRIRLRELEKYLLKQLPDIATLCLQYTSVGTCAELKDDIIGTAFSRALGPEIPRDKATFEAAVDRARGLVVPEANEICAQLAPILAEHHELSKRLKGNLPLSWVEAAADIRDQLSFLIYPGFVSATPREWLAQIPRYLKAIGRRLDRLDRAPDKDRRLRVELEPLWAACKTRLRESDRAGVRAEWRWLVEELRVSLFAQELGTMRRVSVKRVARLFEEQR